MRPFLRSLVPARVVDSHAYVPAIDALRAVAVLSVMLFHLAPPLLPGGFVGVDVFFVISGYVVAGSMMRDAHLPLSRFMAAFYARRFRRIVPALVCCLLATVLVSTAIIPDAWLSHALRDTALAAFFGVSNFALVATTDGYFATRTDFNPFTHTWSLAVEEQFYLLFPPLFYLCMPRGHGQLALRARWALGVLCVASLGWCAWVSQHDPASAYYMLPSRFWELGLGAAAYLAGDAQRQQLAQRLGSERLLAIGLTLIALALAFADKTAFPFPWALPAIAGALAVLVSTADGAYRSRWALAFASRPLVWIGLLSYSLYLWHWPVYTVMRWTTGIQTLSHGVLAVAATFLLAGLSYRLVESPAQRNAALRGLPPWGAITAGVGVVVASWGLAVAVYARPWVFKQTVVERNRVDWYSNVGASNQQLRASGAGCDVTVVNRKPGVQVLVPFACSSAPAHADQRLFVAGDSHAGAYGRLLDLTARVTGIEVWRFSQGGCGLANGVTPRASLGPACVDFLDSARDAILKVGRPGDVVLLDALRVPRFVDQWGPVTPGLPSAGDETAHGLRAQAEREAAEVAQRFTAAGLKVVFVSPKPMYKAPAFRCADWFNAMNPICVPGFAIDKGVMLEHLRPGQDVVARIVGATPGAAVWDTLPLLCPAQTCSAWDGTRPVYFDADHLSGHGNEQLLPDFLQKLDGWLQTPSNSGQAPGARPDKG